MRYLALISLAIVASTPSHAQPSSDAMPPRAAPLLQSPREEPSLRELEDLLSAPDEISGTPAEAPARPSSPRPIWKAQGPGPTLDGQVEAAEPGNEVVGGIQTVLADPGNPDILYAGAVNGGIWRTRNATLASPDWQPLTDHLISLSIGALEMDPGNSRRLVAGIGAFSNFGLIGGVLTGLLLSVDGGDHWSELRNPLLVRQNMSGVAIRGRLLLAAANGFFGTGGLFRSTNLGATWRRVSGTHGLPVGPIFDLVGDPGNPRRFYATVQGTGVFRSDNAGTTWTNISHNDLSPGGADATIKSIGNDNAEMAVAGDGRLYLAVLVLGRAAYIGFSDDHGASWTAMDLPQTPEADGTIQGLNPGGQGATNFSIRADSHDPSIVYVGGDRQPDPFPNFLGALDYSGRLFRGDTTVAPTGDVPSPQWQHLTHRNDIAAIPGGGTASSSAPHADSREAVVDALGDLIEVDDGGIYVRTQPHDNTGDWFSINGNIQTTEFHDIAYDTVSNIIIGGTQDAGTPQQQVPGGTTWQSVSTGDGGDVAVDDSSVAGMSIRYSSFDDLQDFRRETYDAGNHFVSARNPALAVVKGGSPLQPQFVTPVELNAIDQRRLIIGGLNSTYESWDQGETITEAGPGIGVNPGSPVAYGGRRGRTGNPDVLYVGSGSEVFLRTAPAPTPLQPTAFPGGEVRDIVLDPGNWAVAYVADPRKVFVTRDAGATWADISGNLRSTDLRTIAFAGGRVFVGGQFGVSVMETSRPGAWRKFGPDIPNAPVFDLDYDSADDVLVAGTLGRGTWLAEHVSGRSGAPLVARR